MLYLRHTSAGLILAALTVLAAARPTIAQATDDQRLLELARHRFKEIAPAEEVVAKNAALGGTARFEPIPLSADDKCSSEQCDVSHKVSARFIEWLCTDAAAAPLVNHRGITIIGACIDGGLDLQHADVPFPLKIKNSLFAEAIVARGLRIRALTLNGSCCVGLNANSIEVGGDLFLYDGFVAHGPVELSDARIHGELVLDNARFHGNEKKPAITAQNAAVDSNVYMRNGFSAAGTIDFTHATVDGFFQCSDIQRNPQMTLKLCSTRVATLRDDESCWPAADQLHLDGFVYDRLDQPDGVDVRKRIEWLSLQPHDTFLPQPYDQLAKALRAGGYEEEAIEVLVEKERDRASRFPRYSVEWLFLSGFAKLTDFGYRPLRCFALAVGLIFVGTVLFLIGFAVHVVVPSKDDAFKTEGPAKGAFAPNYPRFNAFVFSADSFTPLLDLGQEGYWIPTITLPEAGFSKKAFARLLRWYLWIHIVAGWILSTLIAIGLANLVRQ
jgi:hypothetical protein